MESTVNRTDTQPTGLTGWLREHWTLIVVYLALVAFPFVVALVNGQSVGDMLANETGSALFLQGLLIEIFMIDARSTVNHANLDSLYLRGKREIGFQPV